MYSYQTIDNPCPLSLSKTVKFLSFYHDSNQNLKRAQLFCHHNHSSSGRLQLQLHVGRSDHQSITDKGTEDNLCAVATVCKTR